MGKRLHLDPAAEKEATDIGRSFMNSADVVGDMSRTYGTDLTSIRLHTDESAARRTAERGVDAYSTGRDIFFARGAFDRSDPASRGLLAHELSHSIQQGAGGGGMGLMTQSAPMGAEQGGLLDWFRRLFHRQRQPEPRTENDVHLTTTNEAPTAENIGEFFRNKFGTGFAERFVDPRRRDMFTQVKDEIDANENLYGDRMMQPLENASGTVTIKNLLPQRSLVNLAGPAGGDMSNEDVAQLYRNLMSGGRYLDLKRSEKHGNMTAEEKAELDNFTPQDVADMDQRFDQGMVQLKAIHLAQLRRLKEKYGVYGSQLHPEDFITRTGPDMFADISMLQDSEQMMKYGERYFDYDNNPEDAEYRTLSDYYNDVFGMMHAYAAADVNFNGAFQPNKETMQIFTGMPEPQRAVSNEAAVQAMGAQGFDRREQKGYQKRLRKRFKAPNMKLRLFGRFGR